MANDVLLEKSYAKTDNWRLGAVALFLVLASCLAQSASAGTAFETQNGDTAVYTFGSPVESGETEKEPQRRTDLF